MGVVRSKGSDSTQGSDCAQAELWQTSATDATVAKTTHLTARLKRKEEPDGN
jgi:hypothetical protein